MYASGVSAYLENTLAYLKQIEVSAVLEPEVGMAAVDSKGGT